MQRFPELRHSLWSFPAYGRRDRRIRSSARKQTQTFFFFFQRCHLKQTEDDKDFAVLRRSATGREQKWIINGSTYIRPFNCLRTWTAACVPSDFRSLRLCEPIDFAYVASARKHKCYTDGKVGDLVRAFGCTIYHLGGDKSVYKNIQRIGTNLALLGSFGIHVENWWLHVSSTFEAAVLGWALFIIFMNRMFAGMSETGAPPGDACKEKGLYFWHLVADTYTSHMTCNFCHLAPSI